MKRLLGQPMRSGVFASCCVTALFAPTYSVAQDDGDEAASDVIIVTGTRIARPDATAASPVASFDRSDLNQFRELSVEDFFNELPQFTPDFSRSTNNPGDGTARLNLRGLGAGRTLVLINGRRLAPTGTGTAIDVNTIPNALLKRVEIVTGGASAVYGSDAVTGAVNFITRDDLQGLEVSSQFDIYGAGDGESYTANIAAGTDFSGGRGHISVYADFLERTALLGDDREFTSVIFGESSSTGELEEQGSARTPSGGIFFPQAQIDGALAFPIFDQDGSVRAFTPDDFYNFAPDNFLQTPLTRWSGGALADFELSDSVDLFTELMYTRASIDQSLAPIAAGNFLQFAIDSAFFTDPTREILRDAYDPDGDGIGEAFVGKRLTDVGRRMVARDADYYRGVIGFQARPALSWTIDGHYSYGRNDVVESFINDVSRSRYLQGILVDPATGGCADPSGGCVPVNIFGEGNISPEAIDFIRVDDFENTSQAIQHVASLVATGPVLAFGGDDIFLSGGVEFRRNSAVFEPSDIFASSDTLGFVATGPRVEGAFNVYEIFAETLIPLLSDRPFAERLEIEAGGRFSHYSDAGGVWTWKFGGQWLPVEGLRLRGVWQRAVRAPNISELLEQSSSQDTNLPATLDFCLASNDPVGRGLGDVCIAQGLDPALVGVYDVAPGSTGSVSLPITLVRRGNPDLRPERAGTITAGADYTFDAPFNLNLGASYFSINLKDAIGRPGDVLTPCAIIKDPTSPICLSFTRFPNGFPDTAFDQPINVAAARVKGVDLTLDFSAAAPDWMAPAGGADISVRSLATYYLEFGQATTPATPFVDCAGGFSKNCGSEAGASTYPDTIVNTSIAYDTEIFGAALRWRYIGAIDNRSPVFDALSNIVRPPLAIPRVGARNYLDASVRVRVSDGFLLRAGVDNLLATKPPLLGEQATQSNTDPARYDIFGRRVFVGFEARFGG